MKSIHLIKAKPLHDLIDHHRHKTMRHQQHLLAIIELFDFAENSADPSFRLSLRFPTRRCTINQMGTVQNIKIRITDLNFSFGQALIDP